MFEMIFSHFVNLSMMILFCFIISTLILGACFFFFFLRSFVLSSFLFGNLNRYPFESIFFCSFWIPLFFFYLGLGLAWFLVIVTFLVTLLFFRVFLLAGRETLSYTLKTGLINISCLTFGVTDRV